MYIPIGGSVTFIAKFEDYSDAAWPYMYHCHALTHEDEGMMGSFKVIGTMTTTTGVDEKNKDTKDFSLYPNPANDKLFVNFVDPTSKAYYIRIINASGKTLFMLPRPILETQIDHLYFVN